MLRFFDPRILKDLWIIFLISIIAISSTENPFLLLKENPFEALVTLMQFYGYSTIIGALVGAPILLILFLGFQIWKANFVKKDNTKFINRIGKESYTINAIVSAVYLLTLLYFALNFDPEYNYKKVGNLGILFLILAEVLDRLDFFKMLSSKTIFYLKKVEKEKYKAVFLEDESEYELNLKAEQLFNYLEFYNWNSFTPIEAEPNAKYFSK